MIAIIVIIGALQAVIFYMTLKGIHNYRSIFDYEDEPQLKKTETRRGIRKKSIVLPVEKKYNTVTMRFEETKPSTIEVDEEYEYEALIGCAQLLVRGSSPTLRTIIDSINKYLRENSSRTSDFALIKDIVDRNCDAVEEDTRELIPLPLYCGLAGTMLGIAFGVGSLVFGDGLAIMFAGDDSGISAMGIAPLLRDVSLAMICSFIGLLFTSTSTFLMRDRKTKVEKKKHNFLSWIQAKLLPEMPDNMSSVVLKLTGNLTEFNKSFSSNADRLNRTLESISEASANNARLIDAVNSLKQVQVAEANLALYDRLRSATQQIGTLANYLNNCSSYLNQVKALNDKLDSSEERMKAIEEMGNYFRAEKSQIVHVSRLTQDTIGQADEEIRKSTKQFGENIEKYHVAMQENLQKQATNMEKVLFEQQQALSKKTNEMSQIVAELKSMADVKKTMSSLLEAYREQNRLLTMAVNQRGKDATPLPIQQPKTKLPAWILVLSIVVTVAIVFAVALYVAQTFNLL